MARSWKRCSGLWDRPVPGHGLQGFRRQFGHATGGKCIQRNPRPPPPHNTSLRGEVPHGEMEPDPLTVQQQGLILRDFLQTLTAEERQSLLPEFNLYYLVTIAVAAMRWHVKDIGMGNVSVKQQPDTIVSWVSRNDTPFFPSRKACHGVYNYLRMYAPDQVAYLESLHGKTADRALILMFSLVSPPYQELLLSQAAFYRDGKARRLHRAHLEAEAAEAS